MDFRNYVERFSIDPQKGIIERDKMLEELKIFIKDSISEVENKRISEITPKYLFDHRRKLKNVLVNSLGYPYKQKDLIKNGEVFEMEYIKEEEKYIWYKVKAEIMPNFYAYGILVKNKDDKKRPFVLCQSGLLGSPEIVNGWIENSGNYNHIVRRLLRYDVNVLSIQTFVWSQTTYNVDYDRIALNSQFNMIGGSITSLEMLMFSRTLDYFENQSYVDKRKIGMVGLSFGSMQTLFFSALDKRVKSAYCSCFFNHREKNICPFWSYNNMLLELGDAEIAGLIAPRAVYIEAGNTDNLFKIDGAISEAKKLEGFYGFIGATDKFKFNVHNGGHEYSTSDEGIIFFIDNLR